MYFFSLNDTICAGWRLPEGAQEITDPALCAKADTFLFERDPRASRGSFAVTNADELLQEEEGAYWLSSVALKERAAHAAQELPASIRQAAEEGRLKAVNAAHPRFADLLRGEIPTWASNKKKVVHLLALGDVGSHLLTGLHLLGGDCISRIGICDIEEKVQQRWEMEENQIAYPWDYDALPPVYIVPKEKLFDCDVFIFVASAGIPPVGQEGGDVRMVQYEKNRNILRPYAEQARRERFRGLFCEVADPVDPLAQSAFWFSNLDEEGRFDGRGLLPEQVQGFGLGVMNARAAYYARRDDRFARFLTEGRAFGPHGQELVIADSVENYDDALSRELTQKVVQANLEMRALGYKPFVAPAYSSGALSILLTLRGEWHYGSVFLGGAYMGAKNRYGARGQETEALPLPKPLLERILHAETTLRDIANRE